MRIEIGSPVGMENGAVAGEDGMVAPRTLKYNYHVNYLELSQGDHRNQQSHSRSTPRGTGSRVVRLLHTCVHGSGIHSSQEADTPHVSISG